MSQFDNPEFRKLAKLWDEKLKNSGFEDIERRGQVDVNEYFLKNYTSKDISQNLSPDRAVYNEYKQNYFRLAGFFLHDYSFTNSTDKLIWDLHAQGKSMRRISRILKSAGIHKATTQVKEIIHRLKALMLEYYGEASNDKK